MKKVCIGTSNIASLIARSVCKVEEIHMGEDGVYYGYITEDVSELMGEKKLVFEGRNWLKIYDDHGLVFDDNNYHQYKIYDYCNGYDPTIIIECIKKDTLD